MSPTWSAILVVLLIVLIIVGVILMVYYLAPSSKNNNNLGGQEQCVMNAFLATENNDGNMQMTIETNAPLQSWRPRFNYAVTDSNGNIVISGSASNFLPTRSIKAGSYRSVSSDMLAGRLHLGRSYVLAIYNNCAGGRTQFPFVYSIASS